MADEFSVKIDGIDDLKRVLADFPRTLRNKILMGSLKEAGRFIRDVARRGAPVIAKATKRRNVGTVKKAVSVRVSKAAKKDGNIGVFINVRPLTKDKISDFKMTSVMQGKRWSGSFNPKDPYYWPWLEFGHKKVARNLGQEGGVVTAAYQRLRNGKLVLRKHEWKARSITGRRRLSVASVPGTRFLSKAADQLPHALTIFEHSVIPQINKLNDRKK